jgi:ssDNA-binding Zn-finger/Zn-ribbon topoisomerase 1
MATSLETRIQRLEGADGGGECPRCSGVLGIFLDGEFYSASRDGEEMSKEEWRAHEAEEDEEGRCPACGQKPAEITVGWPEGLPE